MALIATAEQIRALIETTVGASSEYQKKEDVRAHLQAHVTELVRTGVIGSQGELEAFFDTVVMAANALRMVPIQALQNPPLD